MLEIPITTDGLAWIASCGRDKLLLINGLQPASIQAAANGDTQALSHLQVTARSDISNTHDLSDYDLYYPANSESSVYSHMKAAGYLRDTDGQRINHTIHVLRAAVMTGRLAAVQWLRVLCQPVDPVRAMLMAHAAIEGQLQLLQYLNRRPNRAPWTPHITVPHLTDLEHIRFVISEGLPCLCSEGALYDLAKEGDLETLKGLQAHGNLPPPYRDGLFQCAARCSSQSVARWLCYLEPSCRWSSSSIVSAVCINDLEMVQHMRQQDPSCHWDPLCTWAAARNNNLEALRWMRAQNPACPWAAMCFEEFAKHDNLAAMLWLRSQDTPCPWDEGCVAAAAGNGRLKLVQWMRQQSPPCPWDAETSLKAAGSGNLELVAWIRDQGCPIHPSMYQKAAEVNDVRMLGWLHAAQIPKPKNPLKDMHGLSEMPEISVPVLLFLDEIGVALGPELQKKLVQARRSFCTFHGLVRWCRDASPEQRTWHRRTASANSASIASLPSGTGLLIGLSQLHPDLVDKIAVAADIQPGQGRLKHMVTANLR